MTTRVGVASGSTCRQEVPSPVECIPTRGPRVVPLIRPLITRAVRHLSHHAFCGIGVQETD